MRRGLAFTMVSFLLVAGACGSAPAAADLKTHLPCPDSAVESMVADGDNSTVEEREPAELAASLAEVEKGSFAGTQKVVYKSDDRQDIAFVAANGQASAVASYRRDGRLGWRLETALSCP
jgi:hypothetical protein